VKSWDLINSHIPFRGSCAFCGNNDARHRVFDSIVGRFQAGDDIESIAFDFDFPVDVVKAIVTELGKCQKRAESN
jgi:hypothetical protein